jgi:hypothetical protein
MPLLFDASRPALSDPGVDPFSPEMEARVCEVVLGDRRHGIDVDERPVW